MYTYTVRLLARSDARITTPFRVLRVVELSYDDAMRYWLTCKRINTRCGWVKYRVEVSLQKASPNEKQPTRGMALPEPV